MRNPNWTIEELTLALDLYFEEPSAIGDPKQPKVIELSKILNLLGIHPKKNADIKFRNPNGVATKLSNLMHHDPTRPGEGLPHGSKLERTVWEMYGTNRSALKQASARIKEEHAIYVGDPITQKNQIKDTISRIRELLNDLESMM